MDLSSWIVCLFVCLFRLRHTGPFGPFHAYVFVNVKKYSLYIPYSLSSMFVSFRNWNKSSTRSGSPSPSRTDNERGMCFVVQ